VLGFARKNLHTILIDQLNHESLDRSCIALSKQDPHLAHVYNTYGTPPLWDRPVGFATLLNIILEQQVSLASAKACFDKLAAHLPKITPEGLLSINDRDLKTIASAVSYIDKPAEESIPTLATGT